MLVAVDVAVAVTGVCPVENVLRTCCCLLLLMRLFSAVAAEGGAGWKALILATDTAATAAIRMQRFVIVRAIICRWAWAGIKGYMYRTESVSS